MLSLYLVAVFLLHTIGSKNFLVELEEEDENITSSKLGFESGSLNKVLEKIIQEVKMEEEVEEEMEGGYMTL